MIDKNLSLVIVNNSLAKREEYLFKLNRASLRVVLIFSLIILISTILG